MLRKILTHVLEKWQENRVLVNIRLAGCFRKMPTLKKLLIYPNESYLLPNCSVQKTNTHEKSNIIIRIIHEDYKYPLFIRNGSSDTILYKSIIENKAYDFITEVEPKVIVDAGANIGLTTVYFAQKYPNAKIISIEPEDNNFNLLLKNIENYSNVIAVKAALWNKEEEIELLDTGYDYWGFMVGNGVKYDKITAPKLQKKHLVKAITIESLLREYNLDTIDILKIDIEGAEKEAFENNSTSMSNINSIIAELHERMKKGCEAAFIKIAKHFDEFAKCNENFYLSKNGFIKMVDI